MTSPPPDFRCEKRSRVEGGNPQLVRSYLQPYSTDHQPAVLGSSLVLGDLYGRNQGLVSEGSDEKTGVEGKTRHGGVCKGTENRMKKILCKSRRYL